MGNTMRSLMNKKAPLCTFMIFLMLLSAVPFTVNAQTDSAGEETGRKIIEEKLRTNEIDSIQEAVDETLEEDGISGISDFSSEEILENALKGMPLENLKGFPGIVMSVLGKEIKANIGLILELFAVMLLGAVIRALQPLEKGIPNEAAKLGVNGILIIIASVSFGNIVDIAGAAVESMQNIASLAMPALIALMASSGRIVSVTAMQPLMLLGVNVACQIFKNILLPLAVVAGLLFLIDCISERFKLKTLAKLFKSCTAWITGAITLIFSVAVSVQKLASSSVDAVTLRTAKFAIGTMIPVAGKYMSDAAETILLCTSAARNATGILTIIGLGLIFITPFIKVFIVMISLKIAAAFGSPLCDECICDALEDAAGCLSVVLGIMGAALFVLVILTGTLMGSSGLMT